MIITLFDPLDVIFFKPVLGLAMSRKCLAVAWVQPSPLGSVLLVRAGLWSVTSVFTLSHRHHHNVLPPSPQLGTDPSQCNGFSMLVKYLGVGSGHPRDRPLIM